MTKRNFISLYRNFIFEIPVQPPRIVLSPLGTKLRGIKCLPDTCPPSGRRGWQAGRALARLIWFFLLSLVLTLDNSFLFAQTEETSSSSQPQISESSDLKSSDSESSAQIQDASEPSIPQDKQETETSSVLTGGEGGSLAGVLPYTSSTKINVDPSSGSASTSFPISVPPGRAGIQPNLALSYNSSLKNGPLGMGWDLNLGTIEISTKKGFPKYDSSEKFVLNQGSSQELVWDETSRFYRAKIEGTFMKIEKVTADDGKDCLLVTDKKGIKYYFGKSPASRQYDPSNSAKIFKWYLDKVEDLSGNYMIVEYTRDQSQLYPLKISYTKNSRQGLSSYAQVDFEYETRPDVSITSLSGFEVKTAWRLKKINCLAEGNLQQSYDLSYSLSQATDRSLLKEILVYGRDGGRMPKTTFTYAHEQEPSPFTYHFSSKNETLADGDELWNYQQNNTGTIWIESQGNVGGTQWKSYPDGELEFTSSNGTVNSFWTYLYKKNPGTLPVSFSSNGDIYIWVNGVPRTGDDRKSWPLNQGWNSVQISEVNGNYFDLNSGLTSDPENPNDAEIMDSAGLGLVPLLGGDFNGDGLSDTGTYVRSEGKVKVKLAKLDGFEEEQVWTSDFKPKLDVVPGDFNGDGKTDVASYDRKKGLWEVALSNGSQFLTPTQWVDNSKNGDSVYGPNAGDFNGDGLTDVLIFYKDGGLINVEILFSNGSSFALGSPDWRPSLSLSSRTPFVADFNGDGLMDFGDFYKEDGSWRVYLNPGIQGRNFVSAASLSNFGTNEQITIADFNGDGMTDIGYYDKGSGRIYYKIFLGDGSFGPVEQLSFNFSGDQTTMQIQSGDFNGDGLTDYMASNGIGLVETAMSEEASPVDLLLETNNGIGATTELTYSSSCLSEDPLRSMPFCIPLVKSVVVENDLNTNDRYETRYEYTQGLWDWQDREFRGFGTVKTMDPDDNYAIVQFLQDDIYKGRPSKQTSFDASGRKYTETNNTWDYSLVRDQAEKIYFPFLKRSDQYIYEGEPTAKRTAVEYGVPDSYGNLTDTYELGEVDFNTGSDLITQDNRHSQTVYVLNEGMWLLGLPKQTLIKDYQDQILRESRFTYDRLNWGDAPTLGLLTQKEDISGEAQNPITQYDYDDYGNLKKTIDPLGHETTITYDSIYHLFPMTTVNALGQTVITEYYGVDGIPLKDAEGLQGLWGQVKSTTDPNNQIVKKSYDEFGRVKKMISPLDSAQYPTSEVEYDLGSIPIRVKTKARVESGKDQMMKSIQFYDGLGRAIETKSLTETPGQYVVSGQAQYNNRGLVDRQYIPFFTNDPLDVVTTIDPAKPSTRFEYDAMGRAVKTIHPDGTYSEVKYTQWAVETIDENRHMQKSLFDAFGRLVSRQEYSGNAEPYQFYAETKYEYDITGNLTKVIDAHQNETKIEYDKLGRKTKMIDLDMGTWKYDYDLNGNLQYQTDAKGQVLEFKYDALNRLENKKDAEAIMNVDYLYDAEGIPFGRGRLRRAQYGLDAAEAQGNNTEFTYDALGREIESIKTIDAMNYKVGRSYDALNRLKKIVYPQGEELFYSYNAAGQIETVSEEFIPDDDIPPQDQETKLLIHADGEDGSKNFTDATTRHTITAYGDAQIDTAQSQSGGASALFDGQGDYLTIPDSEDWNFGTDDFTVDFWVKFATTNGTQTLFSQYSNVNSYLQLYATTSYMTFEYYDEAGRYLFNKSWEWGHVENKWYHVVLIKSESNFSILVDDGELGSPVVSQEPIPNYTQGLTIGALNQGVTSNYVNGWIDEFKIQVAALPVDYEITLHIAADEGEDGSQDFTDTTGRHAIQSQGGACALFDGDGDYLTIPDSEDWPLGDEDFSIDFWVRFNSTAKTQTFFSQYSDSATYMQFFASQTQIGFHYYNDDGVIRLNKLENWDHTINRWYHVELKVINKYYSILVDGEELGSPTLNGTVGTNYTQGLTIGALNQGVLSNYVNGWIDEFKIIKAGTKLHIAADEGEDGSQYFTDTTGRHTIQTFGQTQIDTAQWKFTGAQIDRDEFAVGGGSVLFDGEGDCLTSADSLDWDWGTKDFRVDFWVKFATTNGTQTLFSQYSNANSYLQLFATPSYMTFEYYDEAGQHLFNKFWEWEHVENKWYHVVLIKSESNFSILVDDRELGSPVVSQEPIPNYTQGLTIGALNQGVTSNYVNGWIDEFKIIRPQGQGGAQSAEPVTYVKNVDYNATGAVTKIEYGNGTKTYYKYNEQTLRLDHLKTFSPAVDPQEDPNHWALATSDLQDLQYTYDNVGNILTITDGSGRGMNQSFSYDELNRLKTARGKYCDEGGRECLKEYFYDEVGNIDYIVDDGVTKDYTYGQNAGPHAVTSITKNGNAWLSFKYDLNGNMVEQNENSVVTAYEYDAENRLTKVTKDDVPVALYEYDGDGGRVKKTVFTDNSLQAKGERVKFTLNRQRSGLTGSGFSFDRWAMARDGSLIPRSQSEREGNSGLGSFAKEPRGSFSNPAGADGIGNTEILPPDSSEGWKPGSPSRGSQEHFNGDIETTKYVGSLYEVAGTKQTRFIFLGGTRIAAVDSTGKTTYYHGNHLGSTNVTTDADGSLDELFENEPFGQITTHEKYGSDEETARWYFTGKELDTESGLIFFGARYYNPAIGRFITPDTLVQDPYNPQTLNRYSYTSNNPINYIDPDGRKWSWTKFWHAAVGAFVGIVAAMVLGPGALGFFATAWGAGIFGGALGGAITGGLDGGWKGALMGGLMGGALGGLGGWVGGMKYGMQFGIGMIAAGGGYAAATGNLDSFAGGLAGGIAGWAAGSGLVNSQQFQNFKAGNGFRSNAAVRAEESKFQRLQGALNADQNNDVGKNFGKSASEPWQRRQDIYDTVDTYKNFGSPEMKSNVSLFESKGGTFEYDPSYNQTAYYTEATQTISFGKGNWENPWSGYTPGKDGLERSLPHEIYHFTNHNSYSVEEPKAHIYGDSQQRLLMLNRGY